ncbi:MAG: SAM-dependent methyltransferase [Waddliaceae bacterium]|nr:SAM-dependent methyltransferase [Waddliaceae bacterium]
MTIMANRRSAAPSSWEKVGKWYHELVGKDGHYYHKAIILPSMLRLLDIKNPREAQLVDIGCGQGILSRILPKGVRYTGVDASQTLLKQARKAAHPSCEFVLADATKEFPLKEEGFSHGAFILSLQNMADPEAALRNASKLLAPGGRLVLILNHPCFRIPRQSSWNIDLENKQQSRDIKRYMSSLEIPMQANPSKGKKSVTTYSYHYPLSRIVTALSQAGLLVAEMEEWCSDKTSTGKNRAMENRARNEIPLFMAIVAQKPYKK